ncbi:MAG: TfoX/Sxy family DNA transformation protein [Bacteroidales bacterium]|nr:TfoX/Sxy family DNA transformation protein [Bacteroidales bacterium]MDD4217756.1 TfoX/Sxy family DNA transformation protein [Bacteroidales bacterium]MDY0142167.1 TfoX/Sxy family DNA transformation protein [Bacteroidales bacterium]
MAITGVHNIGKVLELKLEAVGIMSLEDLIELGTEEAFLRLLANNKNSSRSVMFSLEGAITGVRWHILDEKRKKELDEFYKSVIDTRR